MIDQLVIELLGTVVTVVSSIAALAYWLGRRFAEVDYRFREVNARIDDVEKRLNARIDDVERRLSARIDSVNARIDRLAANVATAMFNSQSLVLEYMGVKGLLTRDEADFLMHEVGRVVGIVRANPITKEELEFIKDVLNRGIDNVTIEELDKVIEIAKRWFMEDGEEIAVRVFYVAELARAYKLHEKYETYRRSRSEGRQ